MTTKNREPKSRNRALSSPSKSRPGSSNGSAYSRLSPPSSAASLIDGEFISDELSAFTGLQISPESSTGPYSNPRSFPYSVKQQCWEKAEKIKGRDPERWRRDAVGNIVFRKLVGCAGCLCHDYDHIVPYSKVILQVGSFFFSLFSFFCCLR